jgi:hypothetical protein
LANKLIVEKENPLSQRRLVGNNKTTVYMRDIGISHNVDHILKADVIKGLTNIKISGTRRYREIGGSVLNSTIISKLLIIKIKYYNDISCDVNMSD